MKTNYFLQTLVMLFFVCTATAQQGINYKAIINDSDDVLASTMVTVQFTILENGTTNVFQESHSPTTDANGILIVNIGEGTLISGDFNAIDWGSNPHFLKTEINSGDGLTDMGTTEFQTVPYALFAKNGSGAKKLNDLSDAKFDGSSLFVGVGAGTNDDGHNYNTATGTRALYSNIAGIINTANGYNALYSNTEGTQNTANGSWALFRNTTGSSNTANGAYALYNNISGYQNTANGYSALYDNTTGINNTAYGYQALYYLTAGNNNIGIGYFAQVPNSTGSNQVRMGNTSITYAGIQVAWTVTSDMRWKEDIRSLPYGLDMLMKLKPVDYIRKNNEKLTREMGIIAQDLEEVLNEMGYEDQGFLIKDDDGLLHLRYNDFTALLIKAIQDQQGIIEEQNVKIEDQDEKIEKQQNEIKSFASEIEENKEEQKIINERLSQLEELF